MDTEKTYSFSFTPDNPEKLEQLFDSLRHNASVVEIKTVSGTEEPDRIIFNVNNRMLRHGKIMNNHFTIGTDRFGNQLSDTDKR